MRDKTSLLTPDVQVQQTRWAFHPRAQRSAFRRRDVRLNPDRSPVGLQRWDTAPTSSGFAEIVKAGNVIETHEHAGEFQE